MEISAENVTNTENDLPANNEHPTCGSDDVVVDSSEKMLSQIVNGAVDSVSASTSSTGDKTSEGTKSQIHDGVKYEWTDITNDFISACASLELGELVHDSKYVCRALY